MLTTVMTMMAESRTVSSPDGQIQVTINDSNGLATYSVNYAGQQILAPSRLGFDANFGDFTKGLTMTGEKTEATDTQISYSNKKIKRSTVTRDFRSYRVPFKNSKGQMMTAVFMVSDNDVAFRYEIARNGDNPKCGIVKNEVSSFRFAEGTTTFLCPQITPMTGWERTKPSYEEEYKTDQPMAQRSQYGQGYTFPCLFKTPGSWVLISETGVDGSYVGSHLSDYSEETGYTIAFPQQGENNSIGSAEAGIPLPYSTPWRTITIGKTLAPIVETTIAYDLVQEKYKAGEEYQYGRYTWSWLIWQDESINYDDQVKFVDLAAEMGFEYCLVDNWWDQRIGRDRIAQLSEYARGKGVSLMLWYNSNGYENDAPQTPRDCMSTAIARDREMAWLKSIGVKGIKVDFFGGDKQVTMQLYEDILFDANRYGLQVIFHGCTIPRGWEAMYPNYIASEAVLASENVFFSEHHARNEAFELCMHPFIRNATGTMDWGGTIMNSYLSRDNKSRHRRYTTDIFEISSAIVNQTPVQCIAMQPNNLQELPQFELDILRQIPTTWDETRFIDGYPGRYIVMARRHNNEWYIAGLNAENTAKKLRIDMPEFKGKTASFYVDDAKKGPQLHRDRKSVV